MDQDSLPGVLGSNIINFQGSALPVEEEVDSPLQKGAVAVVPSCIDQFISWLFLVEKMDKSSFRPVINLKPLNTFIQKEHFKMEVASMIKDLLQPGDWMCSLDLKDAYLAVPIAKEHHFLWNGRIFEFTCLPFGLCSASRVFTKLLCPVMAYLHSQGLKTIIYLASDASGQDNTLPRSGADVQLTGSTGVQNQPSQVTDCSGTANSILGIYSGFQSDEVAASSREARQHCTDLPEPDETTTGLSLSTVSTTRENDSGSPTVLSAPI